MKNIISGLMIYDIQQSMKKLGWEQEWVGNIGTQKSPQVPAGLASEARAL